MRRFDDEEMRTMLAASRPYSIVLLRRAARYGDADAKPILWEHGRRNFELREAGELAIVCPVTDDSDLSGVAIFATNAERTQQIVDGDPAVMHGVLTAEVHPCFGFPGDSLPVS